MVTEGAQGTNDDKRSAGTNGDKKERGDKW